LLESSSCKPINPISETAIAVANKADDSYRDLKTEYEKEKIKEKLD
jgi:hypothetical protein